MSGEQAEAGVFDRRGAQRYPVAGDCELRGGGTRARGECLDISETGAAISVDDWDVPEFTLHMRFRLGILSVRCETVWIEPVRATAILHVHFVDLDEAGVALLKAVVAEARRDFEESQRVLLGGPGRRTA